jgi:phenylacetic acid degradation operon negative regulatory protein
MTVAARPQHLLLTLLGDFWTGRREALPSAALVDLLGEFGVSAVNARAALSRLGRRGLLEPERAGRHTLYRLSERGHAVLTEGTSRIFSFGATEPPWDGRWTSFAFSLPEEHRDRRHLLRTGLRWRGFAPLYDGVWIAPGDRRAAAEALAEELSIDRATIIVGPVSGPDAGSPARSWDLDELATRYRKFLEDFEPLRRRIDDDDVLDAEALVARTSIIDMWRRFPGEDPDLPVHLLPADWPRAAARELFVEVYDRLAPAATRRFREVVGRHAPDLARLAAARTSLGVQP